MNIQHMLGLVDRTHNRGASSPPSKRARQLATHFHSARITLVSSATTIRRWMAGIYLTSLYDAVALQQRPRVR